MKFVFPVFRRSLVLMWLVLIIGTIFIGRLYYLQIIRHDYYVSEGAREHLTKFTIPAKRGLIYARDGTDKAPLVLNEPAYLVYADPRYVKNTTETASTLRRIAGGNVVKDLDTQLGDKQHQYVVLAKQLNKQQADLLKKENLSGIGLQPQERRVYPEGTLAAQALGYVSGENKGQYGIEQALDDQLTGRPGQLKAVTDVRGIPISISDKDVQNPAVDGTNVVLTIDRTIQAYAEQALKAGLDKARAKHGSVVVIDPHTGAVLAMANLPTYDPSKYYDLGDNDYSVYQNPIVSDPYEPGSVIKTLTMTAGLNEGVIKPDSTYQDTGSITVDGYTIKNVLQNVNGTRTMTEVLQYSLNTGVVHVLEQLGGGTLNHQGRAKLYDYFTSHFLLDKKTGIEQTGETTSKIFGPDDEQGNDIRFANMTFGQGMNVSMLQVVSAFSAIINGGTYYRPHLVYGSFKDAGNVQPTPVQIVKSGIVRPQTTDYLKDMIHTARSKTFPGVDHPGYYVGGKTGTAQVIDPKTGKYIDSNAIGTYLGFGGNSTPQYVVMVRVVDSQLEGFAGSAAAAPIFADISNWLLDYLRVQPIR